MISEYSQWFFDSGWMVITAIGFFLGWTVGLRSYFLIVPLVLAAVIGR